MPREPGLKDGKGPPHGDHREGHCRQRKGEAGLQGRKKPAWPEQGSGEARQEAQAVPRTGPGATRAWSFILHVTESAGRSW